MAISMSSVYQQAKEVVMWPDQPAFAILADITTWSITEKDNDLRFTKLPFTCQQDINVKSSVPVMFTSVLSGMFLRVAVIGNSCN